MPPTLVIGVWWLPPFAVLMLVQVLALAVPGAAQETWTATSTTNAPEARGAHTAVWTGSRMVVWGGYGLSGWVNTGGVYDPATDTWGATSTTSAPAGRTSHTSVWTGAKMVVWGGYGVSWTVLNNGGVYDPATDTWVATSTTNAPTPRVYQTAVWTGSRMVVWGGFDGSVRFNTGGVYDLATDTWTPTPTTNAPTGRMSHTAVWTGSKVVVWGGFDGSDCSDRANTGGVYDPATGTWTATSTTNAPTARAYHTAVWTGSKMVVWGGQGGCGLGWLSTGGVYDPATDTWTAMSTTDAPSARYGHKAVWSGSKMIVWGGLDSSVSFNNGGVYDPATDTWTGTSTTDAPTPRAGHTAVWTGGKMIVWAGRGDSGDVDTGGVYSNPAVLPPAPSPASFYTLTPCRLVDTRNVASPSGGPALYPGATRAFPLTVGACGVPSTATAVSVNVTVVGATKNGNLILYRGDVTNPPPTSTINFSAGVTRANNAIVLLAANAGTINVENRSAGPMHLVLDVNGYFQ
jgi:N-acetylneuraminic acid mutarotase